MLLQCWVQGNALGKGPVLFCFSAKGLRHLSMLATAGDGAYQQLELDMHRLGGERRDSVLMLLRSVEC
jgi:hypothetical protein